jgi:hypothetical protein
MVCLVLKPVLDRARLLDDVLEDPEPCCDPGSVSGLDCRGLGCCHRLKRLSRLVGGFANLDDSQLIFPRTRRRYPLHLRMSVLSALPPQRKA